MSNFPEHSHIEDLLAAAGSSWSASQAHGLLCGRIAIAGSAGAGQWMALVLEESDSSNALNQERAQMLQQLADDTWRQLSERQSEFLLLLPDESSELGEVVAALAEWCEGFLHGLVAQAEHQAVKDKLAAEPLSGIIKDLLEITRADAESIDDDENQEAFTELFEYVRVTTQLIYEEMSSLRNPPSTDTENAPLH